MLTGRFLDHVRTPLFRNAYALLVNQGLSSILGVAFWVAAARIFPARVVGQNAALLSTMAFVALLSQLGTRNAMAWVLPIAGRNAGQFVRTAYLVSSGLTLVVAPAILLALDSANSTTQLVTDEATFLAWFTVAAVFSSLFSLQDGVLVGLRAATWVPIENAIFGILKIALLPLVLSLGALGIFAAWTLALVPVVVGVNVLVAVRLLGSASLSDRGEPRLGRPADLVRFISGDYVANLMIQGVIRLVPLLVIANLGTEANAYSFQAWTVAVPVFLVAASMMSSLTVESLTTPDKARAYSRRMLASTGKLMVLVTVLLGVAAPFVLELFGKAYAEQATPLLRVLVLSTLPVTLNVWYYALCRIRGQVAPILVNQAVVAGIAVLVSLVFLPGSGIVATGVGWLLGQSAAAVIVVSREFRWRRAEGLSWPVGAFERDATTR